MSAAAKRPAPGGAGRESTTPSSSPSRPPPRASTPSSTNAAGGGSSAAAGNIARSRSIRSGTPVSARVAAHQRRESLLSNGARAPAPAAAAAADIEREEAARAETVALLDDLKDRLARAETASEQYQKQAEVLQSRLDEALREQARLEEKVHETEEQLESLRNERREAARQMREMESIYEAERSAMTKEKEEMANREEEMQSVIQRLKDSLAQRSAHGDDDARPSRQSHNHSPNVENGSFAPPSSLHRSDSRNNSKLLLQKDKLIESLRLELAEAQIKLVESENQGGGRLQEVERLLMEARMANARLMEDNESYQLLLQERTLKGDFGTSDFSYMGGGGGAAAGAAGAAANQDALNALEGKTVVGTSLADELSEAAETESENDRRLEAEIRALKDQNKALTLYINKIIERLLQHQGYEHILDQSSDVPAPDTNKELPPPPPSKPAAAAGASLLQRAKSIAVGTAAARPRPRPMSFMPSATAAAAAATATASGPSAISNPDTAPSIPIGLTRSTSLRRGRPMSEQYTGGAGAGAGAAGLVHAMYRGAGPDGGPLSPPLRGAQPLFPSPSSGGANGGAAGHRASSGSGGMPLSTSGNFPGMRSETSSTSGESNGEVATPPSQSPPRPDRTTTFAGNKPRPLRLVQENEATARNADGAHSNNKRSSWVAWAFGKKDEGPAPLASPESVKE